MAIGAHDSSAGMRFRKINTATKERTEGQQVIVFGLLA